MAGAPQTSIDWRALIAQVAADIRANKPLAPSPPLTGPQIAAVLTTIQADLPALIAIVQAHQGVITGLDDVLKAMEGAGEPWAADARMIVGAVPGALAMALQYLPMV